MYNALIRDTCLITVGENVLFGPNVSLYGAIHPMDPAERRGLKGPEAGKEIHIEDDVWIGAGATILGGVRVGRGSTVGACSVVTKVNAPWSEAAGQMFMLTFFDQDVPPFHFVAGNPARIIRKIDTVMDPEYKQKSS